MVGVLTGRDHLCALDVRLTLRMTLHPIAPTECYLSLRVQVHGLLVSTSKLGCHNIASWALAH
jgi:hypothetical protein